MIDYAAIAQDALAAIEEAGRSVTLARLSKTLDPVTGAVSATTCVKGSVSLVVLAASKSDLPEKQSDALMEALLQGKLRKLLIAASGVPFEPAPVDIASFDSAYWRVLGCTPLNPAGVALIYTAIVERGNLSAAEITALNA